MILHLDPSKESHVAEVLQPHTDMPVLPATDGVRVEANTVYVIVPDRSLTIANGMLHLTHLPAPRGDRHPIDTFFETLAEDKKEKAIAIVLSGSGSNGSQGVRAIRAQGGMTLVQDPATAEFASMPQSAIAVGAADYILAPDAMPDRLLKYLKHPYVRASEPAVALDTQEAEQLSEILAILKKVGGHDFRGYRKATIIRRVHRRMGLAHTIRLRDYVTFLRGNSPEVGALIRDLMINVTSFFRDPDAWEVLRQQVIAPLVQRAPEQGELRTWVPACSTGAEAYSLAMLFLEERTRLGKPLDIKIFATDASADALAAARPGLYPASMLADLAPERLDRFFDRQEEYFQVKQELRDLLVFAPQNLLQDPPFSKLDLVSCRNVLIYLEPDIQARLIALFHYTLRDNGYLFLGSSETVGRDGLFEPVSKKWRIFLRTPGGKRELVQLPVVGETPRVDRLVDTHANRLRVSERARQILLDRYTPAAVIINGNFRVLHFQGATDAYLAQPAGEPVTDLLVLAREGLRAKLRSVLQRALETNHTQTETDAHIRRGERFQRVQVDVIPLRNSDPRELLVTFRDAEPHPAGAQARPPDEALQRDLQEELQATQDELQNAVEELEQSNEELRAANEEVVSINEELQSSNEELETSKEELQSLNEELSTVNAQLQAKVEELEKSTNDLSNLLANTEVATVFLDPQLRVRNFTPSATVLFNLLPSDIGRPIGHFAPKFTGRDLRPDLKSVLERWVPLEDEVTVGDRIFLRRILPYRARDNRVDGVVLTFIDITERIFAERAIASSKEYAERIVETVGGGLIVLDQNLRVKSANRWFYQTFNTRPEEVLGHLLWDIGRARWSTRDIGLERVLTESTSIDDFPIEIELDQWGPRSMVLDARVLLPGQSLLVALHDVTEQRRFTERLTSLNRGLELRLEQRTTMVQLVVEQIAMAANKARTIDEALQFATERIAEHQGWLVGHAYVRREGSADLIPSEAWYVREGFDAQAFKAATMKTRVRRGDGLVGRVAATGQPFWIEGTSGDDRWKRAPVAPKTSLFFPVFRRERPEVDAVLEFYSQESFLPDPAFLALMANVGIQMAHVLERRELERQLAALSEEEQRRVAQDLHDKVGQSVSAVAMLTRSLQRKLDAGARLTPEDLAPLLDAAQESKVQLRMISRSLLPEELGGHGLVNALEDLAARYSTLHKIAVRFQADYADALSEGQAIQLFRIAQEAVLNAAQHSSASAIQIRLRHEDGHTIMEVSDNGTGFTVDGQVDGMGLRIMRHRANLIDARLEILAAPGGGALVRCSVANEPNPPPPE